MQMRATHFSQYLQDREELRFVDGPHWIYVVQAVIFSVIALCVGVWLSAFINAQFMSVAPVTSGVSSVNNFIATSVRYITGFIYWGTLIGTMAYFLNRVTFYLTTYVFLSDRRLFMKTGLMMVKVNEMDFDEIRSAHLNYGFFGRLLGYARPLLDARFVDNLQLPYIHQPEELMKIIHCEHDLQKDVALTLVTGEHATAPDDTPQIPIPYARKAAHDRNLSQDNNYQNLAVHNGRDIIIIDDDNQGNPPPHPMRRKTDSPRQIRNHTSRLTRELTAGNDLEML